MIITKEAVITWKRQNKNHYVSLGYDFTKHGDNFIVKIEHVLNKQAIDIKAKCSSCKKNKNINYYGYTQNIEKNNGKYICIECHQKSRYKNETCEICGTDKKVFKNDNTGMFLCKKHLLQVYRHGEPFLKTCRDKNEFIINSRDAEIIIDKNGEIIKTTIDAEDITVATKYKWRVNDSNHVLSDENGKVIFLHRLVMGVVNKMKDKEVDHKDKNPLNNRKSNLRICTHQENIWNSSLAKNNTSGVTGVSWNKRRNNWHASLILNGERVFNKIFRDKTDAIKARLNAEKEYFGDFAPQKHLFDKYGI